MNHCTNEIFASRCSFLKPGVQAKVDVWSLQDLFHAGLAALPVQPAWMLPAAVRVDVWVFLIDTAVHSSVTALSADLMA